MEMQCVNVGKRRDCATPENLNLHTRPEVRRRHGRGNTKSHYGEKGDKNYRNSAVIPIQYYSTVPGSIIVQERLPDEKCLIIYVLND